MGRSDRVGRAAGERAQPRRVGARRAAAPAGRGAAGRLRPRALARQHGPGARRVQARRDDPRRHLQALPRGARRDQGDGHARARAAGRAQLAADHRRVRRDPRRPRRAAAACRRARSTSCRRPRCRPLVAPTPEAELRRRLELGDRPLLLSASAKRRHKNLMLLLDAHALLGDDRPLLVLPGYATDHEAELRAHAAGARHRRRRPLPRLGRRTPTSKVSTRRRRRSSSRRCTRASACRSSRRCSAACRSRARAARRWPRSPATPRCSSTRPARSRSRRRCESILHDEALAERLRDAGRAQARRFTWEATARGCLATYERVLGRPVT